MFSKRLRQTRIEKEKTQAEVARHLGISRPGYTAYESGNRQPDYGILQKIADYFNVTTDYLLGRTENRGQDISELDEEILQIMKDLGPDVTLYFHDLKKMDEDEKTNLKIFLQGLKARRGDEAPHKPKA